MYVCMCVSTLHQPISSSSLSLSLLLLTSLSSSYPYSSFHLNRKMEAGMLRNEFSWLKLAPESRAQHHVVTFFVFNPILSQSAVDVANIELIGELPYFHQPQTPSVHQDDLAMGHLRSVGGDVMGNESVSGGDVSGDDRFRMVLRSTSIPNQHVVPSPHFAPISRGISMPYHDNFEELGNVVTWRYTSAVTLIPIGAGVWAGSLPLPGFDADTVSKNNHQPHSVFPPPHAGLENCWVHDYASEVPAFSGRGSLSFCIHCADVVDGFAPVVQAPICTYDKYSQVVFVPQNIANTKGQVPTFCDAVFSHIFANVQSHPAHISTLYEALWLAGLTVHWLDSVSSVSRWRMKAQTILDLLSRQLTVLETNQDIEACCALVWALTGQVLTALDCRDISLPDGIWNSIYRLSATKVCQPLLQNPQEPNSDDLFSTGRAHILRLIRAGLSGFINRDRSAPICSYRFTRIANVLEEFAIKKSATVYGEGDGKSPTRTNTTNTALKATSSGSSLSSIGGYPMGNPSLSSLSSSQPPPSSTTLTFSLNSIHVDAAVSMSRFEHALNQALKYISDHLGSENLVADQAVSILQQHDMMNLKISDDVRVSSIASSGKNILDELNKYPKMISDTQQLLQSEAIFFSGLRQSLIDGLHGAEADPNTVSALQDASTCWEALSKSLLDLAIDSDKNLFTALIKEVRDATNAVALDDRLMFALRTLGKALLLENFGVSTVSTLIGTQKGGMLDGPRRLAEVKGTYDVAQLKDGRIVFVDRDTHSLRCLDCYDKVGTLIGQHGAGYKDGILSSSQLNRPRGVCILPSGAIVVADTGNSCLRIVDSSQNTVHALANWKGETNAVQHPCGLVAVSDDCVIVSDQFSQSLKEVRFPQKGRTTVSVIAGSGVRGHKDGPALSALLNEPTGMVLLEDGSLVFCDSGSHTIRKLSADRQQISTVAGCPGKAGLCDGPQDVALFCQPFGITLDGNGDLIISDCGNSCLRTLNKQGIVTTLAGSSVLNLL